MASHIPQNNGRWSDPARPGDSVWFPDMDSVPAGSNDPYRPKTFRQLVMLNFWIPLNLGGISRI
jgi:hypothetical protein